jgi:hypothetical protein
MLRKMSSQLIASNRYYIPAIYMLTKILYIIAIIVVFFLLEYCLGFKYIHLVLQIIHRIISQNSKQYFVLLCRSLESRVLASTFMDERFFPQRTWCLISRPKLGNLLLKDSSTPKNYMRKDLIPKYNIFFC